MKKSLLLFSATFFTIHVWGQTTTNTFPDNGNVGIGTTNPDKIFTINHDSDASFNIKNLSTSDRFTYLRFDRKDASGNNMHGYIGFDGTNDYLKINNANALSSVEHLIIDRNGYVGIGTTSPDNLFQINTTNTGATELLSLKNNQGWGSLQGQLQNITWRDGANVVGAIGVRYNVPKTYLDFHSLYNSGYKSDVAMTISGDGNIGIGTTDPQKLLTIRKDVPNGIGASLMLLNNQYSNNEGAETEILFTHLLHGTTNEPLRYAKIHTIGKNVWGHPETLSFGLTDNSDDFKDILHIHRKGYVGIGTTDPTYLLSVKGTIGCGEIIVENVTGWADFVFEDDYNLMSLQELDNYIQENKHLPEIPTTEEVQENGISVGEMNAKLLQKIEELTLYVIELQKQNEEQSQEINELKKLIK